MKALCTPSTLLRITVLIAATTLILLAGCAFEEEAPATAKQVDSYSGDMAMDEAEAPSPEAMAPERAARVADASGSEAGGGVAWAASADRKVIKTADLDIEVESLDDAQKRIIDTVDRVNGFIGSMTVTDYTSSREAEITVRVPSDHFREVYEAVKQLGEVKRDHIGGQDVTEEYMDLERRIANLQAQEERVREMFNDAKTVEDLLKVEQRLTEVRGQIEQLQGRLRYLKDQVGFSTLTITLSEYGEAPVEETGGWRIGYHLRGAIRTLIGSIQGFVHWLIRVVIGGLLFWIVLGVVIVLIRNWVIRRRRRRAERSRPPAPPEEE